MSLSVNCWKIYIQIYLQMQLGYRKTLDVVQVPVPTVLLSGNKDLNAISIAATLLIHRGAERD